MIETAEAMKNLEEIVTTPGLEGVYIGPADLTLGLTDRKYPTGFDRQEPEMIEAIQLVLKMAKAVDWGFDLATISNHVRLLATAAQYSVATARKIIGESAPVNMEKSSNGY